MEHSPDRDQEFYVAGHCCYDNHYRERFNNYVSQLFLVFESNVNLIVVNRRVFMVVLHFSKWNIQVCSQSNRKSSFLPNNFLLQVQSIIMNGHNMTKEFKYTPHQKYKYRQSGCLDAIYLSPIRKQKGGKPNLWKRELV